MTHDELIELLARPAHTMDAHQARNVYLLALQAVAKLHKPTMGNTMTLCSACMDSRPMDAPVILYPCPTIRAIEKELL
jgi:hypothetical protein